MKVYGGRVVTADEVGCVLESDERSIASAIDLMSSREVFERDMGADDGWEGMEAIGQE